MRFSPRGLAALATASMLSVALPMTPAMAQKVKDKTPDTAAETAPADYDFTLSIPTIETVESTLDEAAIRAIFDGEVAENAEGLATLNATSITIPEIELTVTDGDDVAATLRFEDIVFNDITDGLAASASMGSTSFVSDEGSAESLSLSAEAVDIGLILAIYGLVPSDSTEMQPVYTNFVLDGGQMDFDGTSCAFGPMSGGSVSARPLEMSIVDVVALIEVLAASDDEPDMANLRPLISFYADLMTAFESTEITMDGYSCEADVDGRAMTYTIGSMIMGGMQAGIYPQITASDISFSDDEDNHVMLDQFIMKQMDITGIIAALQNIPDDADDAWFAENEAAMVRAVFPAIEGFSFSGLAVDVPDTEVEGERIAFSIADFDLTLGNYINAIPTDFDMSASNIAIDLPQDSGDEMVEQLAALGLTSVDIGFRFAGAWDETTEAITVEEASMTGVNLGSINLTGVIANATADLFDLDTDVALMASMGMAVKSLDMALVDEGFMEIFMTAAGSEQGMDAASMRPVMAGLAEGTIISFMTGMANAADLGKTVSSFISGNSKTLNIGVEAKTDPGIGLTDFIAAESDPTTLIGKVNVTATAE